MHVKECAGPWKYPRWIDIRSDLPRTATGKIQRFKLRELDSLGLMAVSATPCSAHSAAATESPPAKGTSDGRD